MRKMWNILLFLCLLFCSGCGMSLQQKTNAVTIPQFEVSYSPSFNLVDESINNNAHYRQIVTDDLEVLEPDGYGLGIHKNRYGQPVIVRPDWGYVPGERLDIKIDAYGLGVHSDQYGRPVREYP